MGESMSVMKVGSIVKWHGHEVCLGLITYIDGWSIGITWADGEENDYALGRVRHKLDVICE